MPRTAVVSLQETFHNSLGMIVQCIDVCPEHLWLKQFGGWPVWQHIYHALSAVDFFVMQEGDSPTQALFSHAVSSLSEVSSGTPTREELKKTATEVKGAADRYFAGLTDASLKEKNEGLSSRMPQPATHASTAAMLTAHTLYHLGSCDAALREHGLRGVF